MIGSVSFGGSKGQSEGTSIVVSQTDKVKIDLAGNEHLCVFSRSSRRDVSIRDVDPRLAGLSTDPSRQPEIFLVLMPRCV